MLQAPLLALPTIGPILMTTVIEFRARRSEADAVRSHAAADPHSTAQTCDAFAGAEIILLPLAWLTRLTRETPRKPLKRRFSIDATLPAPA